MVALATANLLQEDQQDAHLEVCPRALDAPALARLGVFAGTGALFPSGASRAVLPLDWPELEAALPDHGLPRGVVEIAARSRSSSSLASSSGAFRGGATSIALAAIRGAHRADSKAWCAWITPNDAPSLYAPSVAQAGVDLDRLLVVRPPGLALARTAVKVAVSGAFDLVIVDVPSALEGRFGSGKARGKGSLQAVRSVDGALVVRKLALAAEERGTSSILLTSAYSPRSTPWPTALRVEVERRPEALSICITKDRRGSASSQHVVRIAC